MDSLFPFLATCVTRLESLASLVPAGFLTAWFLQKQYIYKAFVMMGDLGWSVYAFLREGKRKCSQVNPSDRLLYPFHFLQAAMQRSPTLVSPSQQRLLKSQFLRKRRCQKPCWDQPRLSSLVNKQVVMRLSEGLTKRWILQNSLSLIKHGYNASVKARNKTMPI